MSGTAEPFPWQAAMRVGFGLMGLTPAEFWRTTPRELDEAARALAAGGAGAPGRGDLDALMRRFPDGGR